MTELILALGAGLLSFLSPCVLPLIPGYISYVSGKSLNELLEEERVNILPIVLFTVGFYSQVMGDHVFIINHSVEDVRSQEVLVVKVGVAFHIDVDILQRKQFLVRAPFFCFPLFLSLSEVLLNDFRA